MRKVLLAAIVTACCGTGGKHEPKEPIEIPSDKVLLQQKFDSKVEDMKKEQDPVTGWVSKDCDAALYTGKLSCIKGLDNIDFSAAEYQEYPGRINRRPPPYCAKGAGSDTTWSRDMGLGAFLYFLCNADLDFAERHAQYGKNNYWKMGEPLDNGRVLYSPNMVGTLYQIIYYLDGEDDIQRAWPTAFPVGLTDYEAHLQITLIWLRAVITHPLGLLPGTDYSGASYGAAAVTDHVTQAMLERIKEHAIRETLCPFYQFMAAKYVTGDYSRLLKLLLSDSNQCEYYRDDKGTKETEWLWAAQLTLEELSR